MAENDFVMAVVSVDDNEAQIQYKTSEFRQLHLRNSNVSCLELNPFVVVVIFFVNQWHAITYPFLATSLTGAFHLKFSNFRLLLYWIWLKLIHVLSCTDWTERTNDWKIWEMRAHRMRRESLWAPLGLHSSGLTNIWNDIWSAKAENVIAFIWIINVAYEDVVRPFVLILMGSWPLIHGSACLVYNVIWASIVAYSASCTYAFNFRKPFWSIPLHRERDWASNRVSYGRYGHIYRSVHNDD